MKKIIIIMLVLISNAFAVVPTDEWKAEDEIDVNQKNKDKKIWTNLLAVYDNSRKIAKGTLKVMERVSEYAWTAQKYLWAIEQTATRAQVIWENIKDTKEFFIINEEDKKKPFFKRVKDAVGRTIDIVEHVEEDIFQQTDKLFYEDIPNYKNARFEMNAKREQVFEESKDFIEELRTTARNFPGFKKKYAKLSQIGSADARVYDNASNNEVKRFVISQSTAIEAIASTDQKQMILDNESMTSGLAIKESSENGGNLNTADLTKTALVNERNSLLLNLKENEILHDAVRTSSQLLLSKIVCLDRTIAEKSAYMDLAVKFSDALIKKREEDKKKK